MTIGGNLAAGGHASRRGLAPARALLGLQLSFSYLLKNILGMLALSLVGAQAGLQDLAQLLKIHG